MSAKLAKQSKQKEVTSKMKPKKATPNVKASPKVLEKVSQKTSPKALVKPATKTAPVKGATAAATKTLQASAPVTGEVVADPGVDVEELEEQQAEAASSTSSGNAAALAAVTGTGEMSASFKNFRHHPDMENFYRFIYDNDLRHEALAIIDEIMLQKRNRKLAKVGRVQAH